jgi:hypothetical protein
MPVTSKTVWNMNSQQDPMTTIHQTIPIPTVKVMHNPKAIVTYTTHYVAADAPHAMKVHTSQHQLQTPIYKDASQSPSETISIKPSDDEQPKILGNPMDSLAKLSLNSSSRQESTLENVIGWILAMLI